MRVKLSGYFFSFATYMPIFLSMCSLHLSCRVVTLFSPRAGGPSPMRSSRVWRSLVFLGGFLALTYLEPGAAVREKINGDERESVAVRMEPLSSQTANASPSADAGTVTRAAANGTAEDVVKAEVALDRDASKDFVGEVAPRIAVGLGVDMGALCPATGEFQGYGCNIGCHCGLVKRCIAKFYQEPSHFQGAAPMTGPPTNVGICVHVLSSSYSYLFSAIFLLICLALFSFSSHNRRMGSSSFARKMSKAEVLEPPSRDLLDERMQAATSLTKPEREAILDQFFNKAESEVADATAKSEDEVNAAIILGLATSHRPVVRHSIRETPPVFPPWFCSGKAT